MAASGEQLGVRSLFDDAAGFEHDDPVGAADRGDLVRDDHAGAAGEVLVEGLLDSGLGLGVQGAGAVVQEEDGGLGDDRAGQGQPLPLSARRANSRARRPGCRARPAARRPCRRGRRSRRASHIWSSVASGLA